MEEELVCMDCHQEYRENRLPRLLPLCGHTYCQTCIERLMITNAQGQIRLTCPQDNIEMIIQNKNIEQFPKNLSLMELLDIQQNGNLALIDESDESNIGVKSVEQEDQEAKCLINIIEQTTKCSDNKNKTNSNKSPSVSDTANEEDYCQLHGKTLEVVCLKQMTRICATCAIFGQHKGHQVKSIEQVTKDVQHRYDNIRLIIERQKELDLEISGEIICHRLQQSLESKKAILIQQIYDKVDCLILKLQQAKQVMVDALNRQIQETKINLTEQIKHNAVYHRYNEWKLKALNEMKNLESKQSVEQQLKYLYYQGSKRTDLIPIGEGILEDILKERQNLENRKRQMLDNINIEFFDTQIKVGRISQKKPFVQLSSSPKSKIAERSMNDSYKYLKTEYLEPNFLNEQQCLLEDQTGSTNNQIKLCKEIEIPSLKIAHKNTIEQQIGKMMTTKKLTGSPLEMKKKAQTSRQFASKEQTNSSFMQQKIVSKKKLKLKLPEKYAKVEEGIMNDQLEMIDLTNGELGDATIVQVIEAMSKKVKTLKLIRNKLTDECIMKILNHCESIITINLSQNFLTDKTIEIVKQNMQKLPNLRNLVLSQNKISTRNVKNRIEDLKKNNNIIISL